jgi:transcriptional regulator with XRE-family HTH domain
MAGFRGDERAADEARALGEALGRLRRAAGLSQAEAGARTGMTGQGWGLYESGRRPGLFRPDVQRRLTAALGAGPESLALEAGAEVSRATGGASPGVEAAGRRFVNAPVAAPAPSAQIVLTDDALHPWASAGTVVEYDPGRFPRRGQGCVLEHVDGTVSVWLFDGADADRLHLRRGPDAPLDSIPRDGIRGLSAVLVRRET